MYKVVKIGDAELPMLSMASVDIYYRQIFHKDAQKIQTDPDFGGIEALNFFFELGFIMNKRAEGKTRQEMAQLTQEDYIDWLDKLDRAGLYDAAAEIFAVYNGQNETTSDSKKNGEELTA